MYVLFSFKIYAEIYDYDLGYKKIATNLTALNQKQSREIVWLSHINFVHYLY